MLVIFIGTDIFTHVTGKVQSIRLTDGLLESNISLPASILETRGLVKLGGCLVKTWVFFVVANSGCKTHCS